MGYACKYIFVLFRRAILTLLSKCIKNQENHDATWTPSLGTRDTFSCLQIRVTCE